MVRKANLPMRRMEDTLVDWGKSKTLGENISSCVCNEGKSLKTKERENENRGKDQRRQVAVEGHSSEIWGPCIISLQKKQPRSDSLLLANTLPQNGVAWNHLLVLLLFGIAHEDCRKSLAGCFPSDLHIFSCGSWDRMIHLQDSFFTHTCGTSMFLGFSLHMEFYPPGSPHVAWASHSTETSGWLGFLHPGSGLPRDQGRSYRSP